jgi:hypothetical protein
VQDNKVEWELDANGCPTAWVDRELGWIVDLQTIGEPRCCFWVVTMEGKVIWQAPDGKRVATNLTDAGDISAPKNIKRWSRKRLRDFMATHLVTAALEQ